MDVDKFLKKQADTYKKAAESDGVILRAIGDQVCRLISRDKDISINALNEAFRRIINDSKSSCGQLKPEQDLERLQAEASLARLESLLSQGARK
ncbi:hypothetical protein GURASL_13250 [Geotalea uraniireducens]|uniref:Uncharacterized protein n=1 Tax=Geotalea uraniireducens TaxID=351604 RepID=A0ABM8EJ25_9BACT|nr:hypothetical protein [Geotalea uraniireducens]BDV42402.1 hypothetical protein GURASL_13250 [Geotalea uraniireducens]